jgi:RNA-directed DNA polymerase
LEPAVEKVFHPDSYGYRPGRSPIDALGSNGRSDRQLL